MRLRLDILGSFWREIGLLLLGAVLLVWLASRSTANQEVLAVASNVSDGGGYCSLSDTGVSGDIEFKGITILKRSQSGGSYCCGFTFDVAMQVAARRGLLDGLEPYDIAVMQKEWYGATAKSRTRQLIHAIERLGIGYEVSPGQAKPGDFVVFSRKGSGHSVIFLDWVTHDQRKVGFKYRSSQPATDGVGDQIEYFTTTGYAGAGVIPEYFFVGRLK